MIARSLALSQKHADREGNERKKEKKKIDDFLLIDWLLAHRITIALEELGIPYNLHKVDITKGEQFSEDFLKVGGRRREKVRINKKIK